VAGFYEDGNENRQRFDQVRDHKYLKKSSALWSRILVRSDETEMKECKAPSNSLGHYVIK
jgi:hypothetical protein